jgi:serine/threonine protein kinase
MNSQGHEELRRENAAATGGQQDALVGKVVEGKYRIERLLGRGGMGSVYEARHVTIDRRFAVKFLVEELSTNVSLLRRFETEALAAGRLEHPNLTAVTDFGRTAAGAPYIVMEYLSGVDCAGLLRTVGPLPIRRAADIVYQACRGLAVAHAADIVHRDIKPENLFVVDAGDGTDLVKVLDFGIAKLRTADAGVATGVGVVMGTCYYMSPEQVRSSGEVDHRTDVWSLGVVLYELLSGHKPFEGKEVGHVFYGIFNDDPAPLDRLRPGLAPGLLAVVERALEKDPDARYPSVTALANDLAPFSGRTSGPPRSIAYADTVRATELTAPYGPSSTSEVGVASVSKGAGLVETSIPGLIPRRRVVLAAATVVLLAALAAVATRYALRGVTAPARADSTLQPGDRASERSSLAAASDPSPSVPEPVREASEPRVRPAETPRAADGQSATTSEQGQPTDASLRPAAPGGPGTGSPTHVRTLSEARTGTSDKAVTTASQGRVSANPARVPVFNESSKAEKPASAAASAQGSRGGTPLTIDTNNPF